MRILIAEDDFASRKLLLKFMSEYGECDVFTGSENLVFDKCSRRNQ